MREVSYRWELSAGVSYAVKLVTTEAKDKALGLQENT